MYSCLFVIFKLPDEAASEENQFEAGVANWQKIPGDAESNFKENSKIISRGALEKLLPINAFLKEAKAEETWRRI